MLKLIPMAALLLISSPALADNAATAVRPHQDVLAPLPQVAPSPHDRPNIVDGLHADAVVVGIDRPIRCVIRWTTVKIGGTTFHKATRYCR